MMRFTNDQLDWIKDNLDTGVFRNQTHFTNVFNAIFGVSLTRQQMAEMLYRRGWRLKTFHNAPKWTGAMEEWLRGKYCECDCDFVRLAREFNETFGTDKSAGCITKFLERKGIHNPRPKKGQVNRGTFKKGMPHARELPIGTIRYNSDGRPFIKVKMCNGEATKGRHGHNYREPWWKPLQKKIWEDHHGPVPEGYIVCTLNGDPCDTDIRHIGLIDVRGTARMAKNGWWDIDNIVIKKDAVRWCNLYYLAKDNDIF